MAKKPGSTFDIVTAKLRAAALAWPETTEEFPWGHPVFKVRGKIFLMLHDTGTHLNLTFKLPRSHMFAKELPGVTATGYGLGKSGWVTLAVNLKGKPDAAVLLDWMDESFRAVAPKAVVKMLG
jgi:predicted DNA-binding protein (MmcQ/YjbR family)